MMGEEQLVIAGEYCDVEDVVSGVHTPEAQGSSLI